LFFISGCLLSALLVLVWILAEGDLAVSKPDAEERGDGGTPSEGDPFQPIKFTFTEDMKNTSEVITYKIDVAAALHNLLKDLGNLDWMHLTDEETERLCKMSRAERDTFIAKKVNSVLEKVKMLGPEDKQKVTESILDSLGIQAKPVSATETDGELIIRLEPVKISENQLLKLVRPFIEAAVRKQLGGN
jgi:hypothetical protein